MNEDQALGRSRGGFGTKVHIAVDALGNPVRLILTGGQAADVTQGEPLIADIKAEHVIADKGYDGNELVGAIEASWGQGGDPTPVESQGEEGVRPAPLQGSEPGRAVHQPGQAVPADRDPVREDGTQLPGRSGSWPRSSSYWPDCQHDLGIRDPPCGDKSIDGADPDSGIGTIYRPQVDVRTVNLENRADPYIMKEVVGSCTLQSFENAYVLLTFRALWPLSVAFCRGVARVDSVGETRD